jgi:hypothetical protein
MGVIKNQIKHTYFKRQVYSTSQPQKCTYGIPFSARKGWLVKYTCLNMQLQEEFSLNTEELNTVHATRHDVFF